MLRELYIKNVAVIEDVHISFENGLNVLSGETGAGKSIIIDSINMILGERSNRDYVRYNADKARVQAVFDVNEKIEKLCLEQDIEIEDKTLILTRDITADGKSTARINGMVVPLGVMREVAGLLVNIHGQHDNQALLSPAQHINFLDNYANNYNELSSYRETYEKLKSAKRKIEELSTGEREKAERADLLRFQTEEINKAELVEGEEEELISQREEILNAEKISSSTKNAYNTLYGSDYGSVYDMLSSAIGELSDITGYSSAIENAYSALEEAKYSIEDVAREIRDYGDNVEFDKEALDSVEQRLDLINNLKRKYGGDVSKILEYCRRAEAELSEISDIDGSIEKLKKEEKELSSALDNLSQILSDTRQKAAEVINEKITLALHELNMEQARFMVDIAKCEPTPKGEDQVQFMICTNGGEPMKPLAKIASGGELSRTMLALKSILSDDVDTMIFDEIDTGVSGVAAKKIAVKLFEISNSKQVLCITHLPQLASMCDVHFLIEKHADEEMAKTTVTRLDSSARASEVARLSGGDITDASLAHAKELLDGCEEYKRRKRV